ncbi:MAG: acyl-CoA dehydratase activase [Lachnospiraceae bacterium]|nr:acyl-CoA dehydratase activase [Lachnospiraceae bacterium]
MEKTYYVCKYTPLELLAAFGGECENLNTMPEGFDLADQIAHPNICGFGKSVLEAVLSGQVKELVLVNCCDTIRSVYDLLEDSGQLDFLYMVDMLHDPGNAGRAALSGHNASRGNASRRNASRGNTFKGNAHQTRSASGNAGDAELSADQSGNKDSGTGFDRFACTRERVAAQLKDLAQKYGAYKGRSFDYEAFRKAFVPKERTQKPHLAVLGARMGEELFEMTQTAMPLPVVNETCVHNRSVVWTYAGEFPGEAPQNCPGKLSKNRPSDGWRESSANCLPDGMGEQPENISTNYFGELSENRSPDGIGKISESQSMGGEREMPEIQSADSTGRIQASRPQDFDGEMFDALMDWYAGELLGQIPCMRMMDVTGRRRLFQDPSLKGIIYHTVKFCDFYSFEYAEAKSHTDLPLLKIESDYTVQSSGQLLTRLEAFAESLELQPQSQTAPEANSGRNSGRRKLHMGKGYYAGIDSGSTSTDVVILNKKKEIVSSMILPTGAGAAIGAERALEQALQKAKLAREDIDAVVTTGYGRTAIQAGDKSITEITCHARGAHFLDPTVRTVVDIGGQDSKVIRLDEDGSVKNFVMNDKCAAGTGRFLEMMARTMEMSLDEIGKAGLSYDEDITISSMCTVFAESEVVSLIAQNKKPDDIVHGLNKAVAAKTAALVKRVGGAEAYMMTGGVAQNKGLVKTLEERLATKLIISDKAQLCGALGAALYAADMA